MLLYLLKKKKKDLKPLLVDSEWQSHSAPQENSLNTNTFWRTPEGLQLKIKTGLTPWCRTPVLDTVYPGLSLSLVLNIQKEKAGPELEPKPKGYLYRFPPKSKQPLTLSCKRSTLEWLMPLSWAWTHNYIWQKKTKKTSLSDRDGNHKHKAEREGRRGDEPPKDSLTIVYEANQLPGKVIRPGSHNCRQLVWLEKKKELICMLCSSHLQQTLRKHRWVRSAVSVCPWAGRQRKQIKRATAV